MIEFSKIKQVFLDMDDTIYKGTYLFPCTKPFLAFLRVRNIGYAFLSNNSSYSISEYVTRLANMGVEVTEKNFYNSTLYCIDYLKRNHPEYKKLYLLGMSSIIPEFEAAGFEIVEDDPDAVIVAFDRTLSYDRLCRAAWFVKQGVPSFATHPDVFCPTDQPTWLVDCGAITRCIEHSTGVTLKVLGKPDPGILQLGAARFGATALEVLMVGDRLATDVAVGRNAGAWSCHISPGCDYSSTPENLRPHLTCRDLGELHALWKESENK